MTKVSYSYKKKTNTFLYRGTLQDCKKKALADIERLQKNTDYLARRYFEEKKRYEQHLNKIKIAKDFIATIEIHEKEQNN